MIGRVVSAKISKTVTVIIERTAKHPLYKKTYIRTKKYLVDDAIGCKEGDMVEIVKIKPVSRKKHWKIEKIVGKNLTEIVEAKQKETAEKAISEVMPEEKIEVNEEKEVVKEKVKKVKKENKNGTA